MDVSFRYMENVVLESLVRKSFRVDWFFLVVRLLFQGCCVNGDAVSEHQLCKNCCVLYLFFFYCEHTQVREVPFISWIKAFVLATTFWFG